MVLGIGTMIGDTMTGPFQAPLFDNPDNYDELKGKWKDVEFKASDGVTLRGWLIEPEGGSKKVIVHNHYGVQSCRCGYTPEGKGMFPAFPNKIEFLKAIPYYLKKGYSVLMFDLRNHGTSDAGTKPFVSWGWEEALDELAAVDWASERFDKIALLSICMGGSATVYAYGLEDSLAKRDKVKAMVFIQPLTYTQMIKNMGIPAFMENMSTSVVEKRLGYSLHEKNFFPLANKVTVPCKVFQNNSDPMHKKEEVLQFLDGLVVEKEVQWLDLDKTRFAGYNWLSENPEPICEWFDKYIQ